MSVHFHRSVGIYTPSVIYTENLSVKDLSKNISTCNNYAIKGLSSLCLVNKKCKDVKLIRMFVRTFMGELYKYKYSLHGIFMVKLQGNKSLYPQRWTFTQMSMNFYQTLTFCQRVRSPQWFLALAHYGLLRAVSCAERSQRGNQEVLREPINPLCSPPEKCYGQQSHTSCRLSHKRLQLL